MKRVIPVLAIGAGMLIASCDDSVSPRESGTASLSIVVENNQAQVDQAMVHLRGPTNRDLSITPGTTDTIAGLQPGSYTVALEGLTNGMVEEFGETTGVQVRAGSNTAVSVTLGSFSTSVDWTHCGNPGEVMMDVSSVGGASQYRIEWDTNSDFSNAGTHTSSSTNTTFDVGSGGAWYYVRAQAVSAYDGSGVWSELDSVLVELLMESHFAQDAEGWTSYDNADSLPAYQDCTALGGSDGCLGFLDWQGGAYGGFAAPTSWTSNADWTDYYGGSIAYKLYFNIQPTDVTADLEIVGPSYSLQFQIYSTCYPQTGVWQEFAVHLGTSPSYLCEQQPEPTNWYISTTGALASRSQILAVLSDVSGFRIRMEYASGADESYLDDVEIRLPGAQASCQRIRDLDPSAVDGDYSITPDTVAFTVYCNDMEGTPSEYLNLVNTGDSYNFAQYTGGGAWPGASARTSYTRIRLDPFALLVNISDTTFTTTTGGNPLATWGRYGTAADCLAWGSSTGRGNIDLTGTPFKVADGFSPTGFQAAGTATFSQNDQQVDLTGGGYCGYIYPSGCALYGYRDFCLDLALLDTP